MVQKTANITEIPGVGEATGAILAKLGLATVEDLLFHFPRRYEDYRFPKKTAEVAVGDQVSVQGKLTAITQLRTFKAGTMIVGTLTDETGKLSLVWFNQPYLLRTLRKNNSYFFNGKVNEYKGKKSLVNPSFEEVREDLPLHSARLLPIYPETAGIRSRSIRRIMEKALASADLTQETLPNVILTTYHLPHFKNALTFVHHPETDTDPKAGLHRFAFEELYTALKTAHQQRKLLEKKKTPTPIHITQTDIQAFTSQLPFQISTSQVRTVTDVAQDLQKKYPTTRLIQGEVGSGKTVIAAFACYCAAVNNGCAVLLAPTQLLAQQHYEAIKTYMNHPSIQIELITSESAKISEKANILIGTHALLHRKLPKQPAVVIVDEEHRFGVSQRQFFTEDKKIRPHLITMTATPIPRTIAATILSESSVSTLEQLPNKQHTVITKVVEEKKRKTALTWVHEQLQQTHGQAFFVLPRIGDKENTDLDIYAQKLKTFCPTESIATLHGRMTEKEQQAVLEKMRNHALDILVSTTVIEVGIDIPSANMMVIEQADRFGLAQLHQLRGRVGRAGQKAYCLLFPTPPEILEKESLFEEDEQMIHERLKAMEKYHSGNELAELDLKQRGIGNPFGDKQSGWGHFRFASLFDTALLEECKSALAITALGE